MNTTDTINYNSSNSGKSGPTIRKRTPTGPTLITHNFPPEGSSTVRNEIGIIWNFYAQHSRRGVLLLAA